MNSTLILFKEIGRQLLIVGLVLGSLPMAIRILWKLRLLPLGCYFVATKLFWPRWALAHRTACILIFIAYIALVSQMKDIKRVFSYHGAEHKTIFCYEHGEELTVENVRKQIRFHPRCGTSFIFVILIISILVASLLILIFPELGNPENRILWMCIKILTLPVTMGLGYEFIRYAGRHENWLTKILSAPGLWMQRLTTKEPDDGMIEVGIAAFKAVITDNPEDDAI